MWLGSIRLDVGTKDQTYAGTDNLVQAEVLRDGSKVRALNLDYATEDDLERAAWRSYYYPKLPWENDETPKLPEGIGQNPMPYPAYGFEFSHGLPGHLRLRLHIHGDDMWIKDDVELYVREIKRVATSFDTEAWVEDANWHFVGAWTRDVALSTDSDEGVTTWSLKL